MMGDIHKEDISSSSTVDKLNALRAGVLGANDGIMSTAGLVLGVAGATTDSMVIFISGLAGLVAGALSMAGGEYVSVSTQRDTEKALIAKEKWELESDPRGELEELQGIYQKKGLSKELAQQVAIELMNKDALTAHAQAELNIDLDHYANPWIAAIYSLIAFSLGALLPLLAITLLPHGIRVGGTFLAMLVALACTGAISAKLGGAPQGRAVVRNVFVGGLAMVVTYGIGGAVG